MSNADLSINVTANTGQATTNIDKLNSSLIATDKAVKKVTPGINTAGQSLTNLGRIAQDAPFGFIGIQNNLNPLLESFQRLKAETGSTGSALKALGSSMLGAGGIGLALSVASAAVLFFQSGLFSFGESTKKAKAAAKEFADSLKDAEASAVSSGLQLKTYANIAADTTNSLEQRNAALDKANKIMGEHGEKLTLVNVATKAATDEIDKFTQATIQQALAAKFSDKAADLIIKQRDAIKDYTKTLNELAAEEKRISKESTISGSTGGVGGLSNLGSINQKSSKFKEAVKNYKEVTNELKAITGELFNAQDLASKLFGELGTKLPEPKAAKIAKDVKEKVEKAFEAEKISLLPEKIEVSSDKIKAAAEKAAKDFQDSLGKKPMKTKLQIESSINYSNKDIKETADEFTLDIAGMVQSISESIGSGENLFSGFMKTLGSGLSSLGKYMISISKIIQGIKIAMKTLSPTALLIGGIALVGIGAALSKAKIPGFADGVTNFGGGIAMVGERGPELVRLPKGSDVIPNGRVNGMGASNGTQVFIPAITLRGQDLVLAFNRANQTISRNG